MLVAYVCVCLFQDAYVYVCLHACLCLYISVYMPLVSVDFGLPVYVCVHAVCLCPSVSACMMSVSGPWALGSLDPGSQFYFVTYNRHFAAFHRTSRHYTALRGTTRHYAALRCTKTYSSARTAFLMLSRYVGGQRCLVLAELSP